MKDYKLQKEELMNSIQDLMPFDVVIGEPYVNVSNHVGMPFNVRFYKSVNKAMIETKSPGFINAKFTFDAEDEFDASSKAAILTGILCAKIEPTFDLSAIFAERLDENARRAYGQAG